MKRWLIAALVASCGGGGVTPGLDGGRTDGLPEDSLVVIVAGPLNANFHVAFQSGDGAWEFATPLSANQFAIHVTGNRYGIAVMCNDADTQDVQMLFSTVLEEAHPAFTARCGGDPPPLDHAISGTIGGLTGGGYIAQLGSTPLVDHTGSASATYAKRLLDGMQVLSFGRFKAGGQHVDKLIVRPPILVSTDQVVNANFGNVEAVPTESRSIAVMGAGSDLVSVSARFTPLGGSSIDLTSATAAPLAFELADATQWRTGDTAALTLQAADASNGVRHVSRAFFDRGDIPVQWFPVLPAPLDAALVAVPGGFRATWTRHPTATGYTMTLASGPTTGGFCNPACAPRWTLDVSPEWLGATTDLVLQTPNINELRSLGLWDSSLDMQTGVDVAWTVEGSERRLDGFIYAAGRVGTATPL